MSWPDNYAHIQRLIELSLHHHTKPCLGPPCALDVSCRRHARTLAIILRYERIRKARALPTNPAPSRFGGQFGD